MGMSFGLGSAVLTLLLARWSPVSPQAADLELSGIGTKRRFWKQLLTNNALRQGLLVGRLFGLSWELSFWLSDRLSGGLSLGLGF
jgi:hypothetical protein